MNTEVKAFTDAARPEDAPPRRVYHDVTELVADPENPTPMVRLSARFNSARDYAMYIKLERNNPFGSIKDRTALYLLNGTKASH